MKTEITEQDKMRVLAAYTDQTVLDVELTRGAVDDDGIGYGPSITVHTTDSTTRHAYVGGGEWSVAYRGGQE